MKKVLLAVVAIILSLGLLVGCSGNSTTEKSGNSESTSEDPIVGSWNCLYIMHDGQKLEPTGSQVDDYTLDISGNTVNANMYGTEFSGNWERMDSSIDTEEISADFYKMSSQGAEFIIEYFADSDSIIFNYLGKGIDGDNYVAFKRSSEETSNGNTYNNGEDYDSNEDYDSDENYNSDDYDDWDTDDNGSADWQDVDTDDDGDISSDEMKDYLDDWETELNK